MMSKSNTKVRKLGAIRQSAKTPGKDDIPKLSSFHSPTIHGTGDGKTGMAGITGNAMAVPPQREKNIAREKEAKPSSVSVKSDSGKSDSASSTKSQDLADKKEIQDLKARERDLLKQISSLQKQVEDLQEQIRNKEVEAVTLQDQILRQEEAHKAALLEEKTSHDTTRADRDNLLKELEALRAEIKTIREENAKKMESLKKEMEEKHSLEIAEKDKEIKLRDEKLNRLKMQMADALKGNSWERQQQLEELTKELGRLQEEADSLRMKLKSFKSQKNNQAGQCGNCQESQMKLEKYQLAVKERDANIKDLKALVTKFEKQLTQQDELLKSWAESKGHKIAGYPGK
ncbi:intraflagellar transport protein 74 homolog [Argopecten irradians]|uniref:intraflagellar transport protein 74 homolog n=1 Tax=Argopecten irradians TaxID=31199 RepID=UPI003711B219